MSVDKPLTLGPFSGGLNLASDPTDVDDKQCVEALNFDLDPNGALKSRPPFVSAGSRMPLGLTGNMRLLGIFYANDGTIQPIGSDGVSKTYRWSGTSWATLTSTFAATAMVQFDGKAWLVAPVGSANPGGYWVAGGSFVADANMPKGTSIAVYKDRMWIASGALSTSPTSMFYSKLIVEGTIWASAASREVQVSPGDGQAIVSLQPYFGSLLVFRNQSIYSYSYSTSTAAAVVSSIAPGIGLTSSESITPFESYLYFMYDGNAYEFVNARAQRINQQVPFAYGGAGGIAYPFAVSTFGKRILFSYYDYIYVFNTDTRSWTRWKSTTWGAIGKVLEPIPGTSSVDAFAATSSDVATEDSTVITNYNTNPQLASTSGYNTAYGGGGTGTITATTVAGSDIGGYGIDTFIRHAVTTVGGTYYDTRGSSVNHVGMSGVTGKVNFSVQVRASSVGDRMFQLFILQVDASGTVIQTDSSTPVPSVTAWTELKMSAIFLPETVRAVPIVRHMGSVALTSWFDTSAWCLAQTITTYIDGDRPDTSTYRYDWTGPVNASTSTRTTLRNAYFLRINEALTASDKETFTCVLQTKNYSYDLPSNHKRMWWWGADTVFRGKITGTAIPILQTASTTWGALWSGGGTWADMLATTWDSPIPGSDPVSEITTYDTQGLGYVRKFVKFKKAMRFRQVYFKVEFTADGSINTSPVYLFTLRARLAVRQTVSKAIS